MLTLSKEISINPSNYVELRGRERAHALIDELFGKPVNRGANPLEGEVSGSDRNSRDEFVLRRFCTPGKHSAKRRHGENAPEKNG